MRVRLPRCRAWPIGKSREVVGDIPRYAVRAPGQPVNTVADTPDFV